MIMMELPLMFPRISWNMAMRFWKLHRSMPASGSSKMETAERFAKTVAISMRFSSPPERLAFTSRFT